MKILLVEDDLMIAESISRAVKKEGYAVNHVDDGEQAITTIQFENYDLVLLDLGLPRQDGFTVLQHIRQKGATPVLILTARDHIQDRIHGLDLGADDYLVKPFDIGELLARIRAVHRRHSQTPISLNILQNNDISLNISTHEVSRNEQSFSLSAREFALLREFLTRPGHIFSRADLEEKLYGWNEEVESNAIEYLIHALRKKLGNDAIKNIRGAGWMVSAKK